MNKERILALADLIETLTYRNEDNWAPDSFNMGRYSYTYDPNTDEESGHVCDTPACIAGWAYAMKNNFDENLNWIKFESGMSAEYLGLTSEQASELFYGRGFSAAKRDIEVSPEEAAKTLRHLAETGEVDWFIPDIEVDEVDEF